MKTILYISAFILLDVLLPREDKGGCSCSGHHDLEDIPVSVQSAPTQATIVDTETEEPA